VLHLSYELDYKFTLLWAVPKSAVVEALVTVLTDEEKPQATFLLYLYFVLKISFWVLKLEKIWFHPRKTLD
jgi:hypothetical protein